ncbi:TetR/AcrR family transcriptional regulator [Paenibacillus eucommiae]|uniref:TetR/AcrR family hemagglutinin/protease transcriptional regulator n=1 Tax=Paenibacillus eucommiae TaxID=1355755 RepID=A0ABS4J1C3_9BACL|nr:TetR/AcrR family transcriptional regulator [Paenibacillus eucommiae]MBP1993633.1 TetR/AcrR family hemagglutinin/protease transcriptional regulator [Paenibacillus eucommiae]
MARNVERDAEFRERQRNNIMEKATQLFALSGLRGVRMQDIAQAVGITTANVYHYFSSKEELIREVITHSQTAFGEALTKLSEGSGTPWDKLVSIGSPKENKKSYIVLLHLNIALSEALPEALKQQYKSRATENLRILSGIVAEGQRQGQIKAGDPMQMAARYVILLTGFNVYSSTELYEGIRFKFEDIIAHLRP